MNEDPGRGEGGIEKLAIARKAQNRYLVNGSDTPIERERTEIGEPSPPQMLGDEDDKEDPGVF